MAPKKSFPKVNHSTSRDAADYTSGILAGLEKLARTNSHGLLAHLLQLARHEAIWLSRQ